MKTVAEILQDRGEMSIQEYDAFLESTKTIPTQQSLNDAQKPKESTTNLARAIEIMMRLAPDQQEAHLDWLEKSLNDDNAAFTNAGIPDDYAAKNRASVKNAQKMKKTPKLKREDLDALMQEAFPDLTPELHERFVEVFDDAVSHASARNALKEIFIGTPEFALLFDQRQLDLADYYANRIVELEEAIAEVEHETALIEARMQEQESLSEDVMYPSPDLRPSRRRSLNPDDLSEVSEDNAGLIMTEDQHSGDPRQRAYLNAIQRSVGS
jgi:hypothetical protein